MLLETNDLTEAERKRELVETVTGSNDDAVDQLRAVRQSLEQTARSTRTTPPTRPGPQGRPRRRAAPT